MLKYMPNAAHHWRLACILANNGVLTSRMTRTRRGPKAFEAGLGCQFSGGTRSTVSITIAGKNRATAASNESVETGSARWREDRIGTAGNDWYVPTLSVFPLHNPND